METLVANGRRGVPVLPPATVTPLRERARIALEIETARDVSEERARREAELRERRDALVRLMRGVLGERIGREAIPLPEDPMAAEWTEITACVDDLTFRAGRTQAECLEGQQHLKVSLPCPVCHETSWHPVPSLGALGRLLQQAADGSLAEACPTCLMAREWEDDPFAGE